jgi:hypothetical protein
MSGQRKINFITTFPLLFDGMYLMYFRMSLLSAERRVSRVGGIQISGGS